MIGPGLAGLILPLIVWTGPAAHAAAGLCFPRKVPADGKPWPICTIYMHGLFGGPKYPPGRWEGPFHRSFERIARAQHCLIAAPFGNPVDQHTPNVNWRGISLNEVKKRAQSVCGHAAFAKKPSLIGFSAGGINVRGVAVHNCSALREFGHVTIIGPNTGPKNKVKDTWANGVARSCRNVEINEVHDTPTEPWLMARVPKSEDVTRTAVGPTTEPTSSR